jgi:arylsulfatase A-like enzyme
MRLFLPLIAFVFALAHPAPADLRPNIVFVLADDLRWDALRPAGNQVVETPNIDALAAGGVRFTQSFVTTSICCVSRASLLCGQYERRHGIGDFERAFTSEQWKRTYPALLRAAGYHTGFIGKFGVGNAKAIAAMSSEFDFWRGKPGQAGPFFDPNDSTRTHATARFGDEALEFIRTAPSERPLCLSLSFSAPHARDGKPREFEPDSRDESLYAESPIPVSNKTAPQFFDALPDVAKVSEGRKRWERRFDTPERFRETVRDYLRLVSGIDREIGRMREALEKRGLANKTVIIFTSDNGFFFGERGLADKWLMYEESIRVPLIVYDPRLPRGRHGTLVDQLVLNIDIAPTVLEMAGLIPPTVMQGRSLVPLVSGEAASNWRTDFFYEHHFGEKRKPPIPATEGVREVRWKYTRWVSIDPVYEELFDLEADPGELRNLSTHPSHGSQLERLRQRWRQLAEEVR